MIEKLDGQELTPDAQESAPFTNEGPRFGRGEAAEPADAAAVGAAAGVVQTRGADVSSPPAPSGDTGDAGEESIVPLEPEQLRRAIEAALFSLSEPITIRSLADLLGFSVHDVRQAVEELRLEYIDARRAFRIEDIAGGVQILTVSEFDPWIRRLREKERESRLSAAALESLAVIAYKQPISRVDLEAIRGVGCGPTLKTLLERGLIQIAGRGEGLGKPLLYGTTRRFLESFGISSVRELPQPELTERPRAKDALPPPQPQPESAVPQETAAIAAPALESAPADEPASSLTDAGGPLS